MVGGVVRDDILDMMVLVVRGICVGGWGGGFGGGGGVVVYVDGRKFVRG